MKPREDLFTKHFLIAVIIVMIVLIIKEQRIFSW